MKEALVTEKSKLSLDVQRPLRLLKSCPAYVPTPLIEISPLEGVRVLIKDETDRMGLKAFKGLGGVYAVVRFLLDAWLAETGNNVNPDKYFAQSFVSGVESLLSFVLPLVTMVSL